MAVNACKLYFLETLSCVIRFTSKGLTILLTYEARVKSLKLLPNMMKPY